MTQKTNRTKQYIKQLYEPFHNQGEIYCISSLTYKETNRYKIGMTTTSTDNCLLHRYKTYFAGETPEIEYKKTVGDTKNAEKLIHFLLKDYRLGNTEWFQGDPKHFFSVMDVVSNYYPTKERVFNHFQIQNSDTKYIEIVKNIAKAHYENEKYLGKMM